MRIPVLCLGVLTLTLVACNGDDDPPPPPPNVPPLALAGFDMTAPEYSSVTLNGGGSLDSDGVIQNSNWTQTSGPPVTINNSGQLVANFDAPVVASDTMLSFDLTVTDDDNASDTDSVTITVQPAFFSMSGTITAASGTAMDGDVNDPNATQMPNNDAGTAQIMPNPITVGGYVNVAGAGEAGPLQASGDRSDYYRVNLIAGQTITLLVSDPSIGDPDLYLWDPTGINIIDSSVATGPVETLVVATSGEYLVEAYAFAGASNYVLIIGQTQTASSSGSRLSDPFVPGDVVMRYETSLPVTIQQAGAQPLMSTLGLEVAAGAPDRPMLLKLNGQANRAAMLQPQGDETDVDRFAALANEEQRLKLETLLAIKALNRAPGVAYAEANQIVQPLAVPDDEYYPYQWHYPLISLPSAWDITTGSPSVTVAVIDTGVLLNHPDIQGQLVPGYDFISDPGIAVDGDGIDPDPDDPGSGSGGQPSSFHGTHVAGTIAAASNNGSGVAGVAWNVRIMPLRVLGVGGGTAYDIVQSVLYASGLPNDSGQVANPPVDVVNMSLGGSGACPTFYQDAFDSARAAGVVVVVAAGNEDTDASNVSPASCNNVVTVSSVTLERERAYYSNFGAVVDVAAPGGDTGVDLNGDGYADGVLSLRGDDSSNPTAFTYSFLQGTSMASPHMAGVVALMKSANPSLTPAQVDQMLANGELTDDIGDPNSFGNGLINAHKAVVAALNAVGAPPGANPTLDVTPRSLNFGAQFTTAQITARNTGGGTLQANPPTFTAPWLSVTPVSVGADNLGTYAVSVNRSGLGDGTYSDTITIQSNVNTQQISVIMQVSGSQITFDAGYLYLLLIDDETGNVVEQLSGAGAAGTYTYDLIDIEDGFYRLFVGTDSDNDGYICDSGEACGAYQTLEQPEVIFLDQDFSGLDFPAGHIVAIPAQSADADAAAEGPQGYRRLVEQATKQLEP